VNWLLVNPFASLTSYFSFFATASRWMGLGVAGTEHVAGTTSALDVFAAAA